MGRKNDDFGILNTTKTRYSTFNADGILENSHEYSVNEFVEPMNNEDWCLNNTVGDTLSDSLSGWSLCFTFFFVVVAVYEIINIGEMLRIRFDGADLTNTIAAVIGASTIITYFLLIAVFSKAGKRNLVKFLVSSGISMLVSTVGLYLFLAYTFPVTEYVLINSLFFVIPIQIGIAFGVEWLAKWFICPNVVDGLASDYF